jgi:hypothetical protein
VRGLGSGVMANSLALPALPTAVMNSSSARIILWTRSSDSGTRARSFMATRSLTSTSCWQSAGTDTFSPCSEGSLGANSSKIVSSIGRMVL